MGKSKSRQLWISSLVIDQVGNDLWGWWKDDDEEGRYGGRRIRLFAYEFQASFALARVLTGYFFAVANHAPGKI